MDLFVAVLGAQRGLPGSDLGAAHPTRHARWLCQGLTARTKRGDMKPAWEEIRISRPFSEQSPLLCELEGALADALLAKALARDELNLREFLRVIGLAPDLFHRDPARHMLRKRALQKLRHSNELPRFDSAPLCVSALALLAKDNVCLVCEALPERFLLHKEPEEAKALSKEDWCDVFVASWPGNIARPYSVEDTSSLRESFAVTLTQVVAYRQGRLDNSPAQGRFEKRWPT